MALEHEFRKAKSSRIVYKGREIFLDHQFPIADGQRVELLIESYDSDWGGLGQWQFHEGVWLMTDRQIVVSGLSCKSLAVWPHSPPREQLQPPWFELLEIETGFYIAEPRGGIRLWLRNPFEPVELVCGTRDGHIHIWNVWNDGDVRHATDGRHNGAGMIVEELDNGFRYRCNDGYPDEDFDDIVFRIERL